MLNNAKEIRCSGGIAIPVNPYDSLIEDTFDEYWMGGKMQEFNNWLSQQPPLHTNAADGIYPVGEFGEVVWQKYGIVAEKWLNADAEDYVKFKHYEDFSYCHNAHDIETRLHIEHIGPKNKEREPLSASEYLNLYGSADNMYLKTRISSNEYFKLPEDQRRFYIRFSGQIDVHYELNPMASNQPFDFAAVLEKEKGIAFPDTSTTPEQKGVEQGEEKSKWVKVSDRLPEIDAQYNVCFLMPNGEWQVFTSGYSTSFKRFDFGSANITHWMPLPEPPTI